MATLTLRVGYDLIYECPQPTPMMLMLHIHHTRAADIIEPDLMQADPFIPTVPYRDGFGNWCTRILAPAGRLRLSARALLRGQDSPFQFDGLTYVSDVEASKAIDMEERPSIIRVSLPLESSVTWPVIVGVAPPCTRLDDKNSSCGTDCNAARTVEPGRDDINRGRWGGGCNSHQR